MKKLLILLMLVLAFVQALSAQNNDVITLFGYLHVFPNDLGEFDSEPTKTISNINENSPYGYCTWRIPTKEELSLLKSNNIVPPEDTYISSEGGNISGKVRLVTDDKMCSEIKEQRQKQNEMLKTQGAIIGVFSVSSECTVYFSKGNLQYQASTKTWRFADNQYDYIGESNNNISSNYNGWIDLFYRGSGSYPLEKRKLTDNFDDWGSNTISNGRGLRWRTLTLDEWNYILNERTTLSGIRYIKAVVNGINGVILLPDNWNKSYEGLRFTNNDIAPFDGNNISYSTWINDFESNGAVFLPAAGEILTHIGGEYSYNDSGLVGCYWTWQRNKDKAYMFYFNDDKLYCEWYTFTYNDRLSVRLVCPVDK